MTTVYVLGFDTGCTWFKREVRCENGWVAVSNPWKATVYSDKEMADKDCRDLQTRGFGLTVQSATWTMGS